MNMEGSDTWDEEQIEAFEHDRWLLMQELGDDYYKLYKTMTVKEKTKSRH